MDEERNRKLHSDLRLGLNALTIDASTERMLKDRNIRLSEDHEPNPERKYATGMVDLILDLAKDYSPEEIRQALKTRGFYG